MDCSHRRVTRKARWQSGILLHDSLFTGLYDISLKRENQVPEHICRSTTTTTTTDPSLSLTDNALLWGKGRLIDATNSHTAVTRVLVPLDSSLYSQHRAWIICIWCGYAWRIADLSNDHARISGQRARGACSTFERSSNEFCAYRIRGNRQMARSGSQSNFRSCGRAARTPGILIRWFHEEVKSDDRVLDSLPWKNPWKYILRRETKHREVRIANRIA